MFVTKCSSITFTLLLFQDQYDNLSIHTSKGIEFLEKYGGFVKERILIEKDYAAKLR